MASDQAPPPHPSKEHSRKLKFHHAGDTPPRHHSGATWEDHPHKKRRDGAGPSDGGDGGAVAFRMCDGSNRGGKAPDKMHRKILLPPLCGPKNALQKFLRPLCGRKNCDFDMSILGDKKINFVLVAGFAWSGMHRWQASSAHRIPLHACRTTSRPSFLTQLSGPGEAV